MAILRPVVAFWMFCLVLFLVVAQPAPADGTNSWAFAAFADNRSFPERSPGAFEGVVAEIRDMRVNPEPGFPAIEFVVGCGDLKLAADGHRNWDLWVETFKTSAVPPCFYPLVGNWDGEDVDFNRKEVLPRQKNVSTNDPYRYTVDWKNVRLVVSRDLEYVEKAITNAPRTIEHVFVADHYPIFPRNAHEGKPDASDTAFWNMLVKHNDIVRAFLVGHTHTYSRMRVADPKGKVVEDEKSFPDEAHGIYQVDCGNAGRSSHGETSTTIVEVSVDGPKVRFRVIQAPNETPTQFKVRDQWEIRGTPVEAK